MTSFRRGDLVSIECAVKFESDGTVYLDHHGASIYAKPADVTMVAPKFETGEIVGWGNYSYGYEIKGIENNAVWLRGPDGRFWTTDIYEIKRVEPAEPEAAPVEPPAYTPLQPQELVPLSQADVDAMTHASPQTASAPADDEEIVF